MDPRIEKVLKLPNKQKVGILVAVALVELVALLYFLYLPKHNLLMELKEKHQRLQAEVVEKTKTVQTLPKLQTEYDLLNKELELALTELPNSKEIPSLLTSITTSGKASGLDFLVFKPKPEVVKEFYAEVPVDITVYGSFHSVANFFSTVGNLPRIVNITNVNFTDVKLVNNRIMTKVTCLATTFRFLGKEEAVNDNKNTKKK